MTLKIIDEGQDNIVVIGDCPSLQGLVTIKGNNNTVRIGATNHPGTVHVLVHADSIVDLGERFGFGEILIYLVAERCHLTLGNDFLVNGSIQITMHEPTRFSVGSDCLIASGASFQTSDVHGIYDLDTGARTNIGKD